MKFAVVIIGCLSFGITACSASTNGVSQEPSNDSATDTLFAESDLVDSAVDEGVAEDSAIAPVLDSTSADDGSPPVAPECVQHAYSIDKFSNLSRADALSIPLDYSVWVSGVRPDGNTSGVASMQYFSFSVTTPRSIDVSFGGSKSYAAFYFGTETTSRFALGGVSYSKYGVPLEVGTYTVEIGDKTKRDFGDGATWEVYLHWSSPPPACTDAGVSD